MAEDKSFKQLIEEQKKTNKLLMQQIASDAKGSDLATSIKNSAGEIINDVLIGNKQKRESDETQAVIKKGNEDSKTITGIECSTVYITSFQNIIQHEILSSDRIQTVGETFKKFDQIVTAGTRIDKGEVLTKEETEAMPKLDEWEAKIYTLFSLLQ